METIVVNSFKKGMKIEIDNEPFLILDISMNRTGRGVSTSKVKLRSLITGQVNEKAMRGDEKYVKPDFEEKEMQYLYADGDMLCFMDNTNYEQIQLHKDLAGDDLLFLVEQAVAVVQIYRERPVGIVLPNFVELEVAQTDAGVKGDTVTGGSKPATLSTGGVVNVPLFIAEGDVLKVDTRTKEYIERVRSAGR